MSNQTPIAPYLRPGSRAYKFARLMRVGVPLREAAERQDYSDDAAYQIMRRLRKQAAAYIGRQDVNDGYALWLLFNPDDAASELQKVLSET